MNESDIAKKIKSIVSVIHVRGVDGTEVLITDDEETKLSLYEVYDNISVLNNQIRKLEYYDTDEFTPIHIMVIEAIYEAKEAIKRWKNVKYNGVLSDDTHLVYTGFRGVPWYDEPLREFLYDTMGNVFVVGRESILVEDMRSLLRLLNTLYKDITNITVGKGWKEKYQWQVPKNALVGIIQQLMLIEMTPPDSKFELPMKVRSARKTRRDRAMYKIGNDFQVNTTTLENVFRKYGLLNYTAGKIMDSCGIEMFKRELPTWIKHVVDEPEIVTVTKPQKKEYFSEIKKIKKLFLKQAYGKLHNMKDANQDTIFIDNLEKYNNGEFTRLKQLDMSNYDRLHNMVSSQIH